MIADVQQCIYWTHTHIRYILRHNGMISRAILINEIHFWKLVRFEVIPPKFTLSAMVLVRFCQP